jgi:hypothetical protein
MKLFVSVTPDWEKVWTAAEAEEQLTNFRFTGPGWYSGKKDTLLVLPADEVDTDNHWIGVWKQRWPPKQLFRFCVYSGHDPANSFNAIANAPVRQDER